MEWASGGGPKSEYILEYFEFPLRPRNGNRGRGDVGMVIWVEDGSFTRFRRFPGGVRDWRLGNLSVFETIDDDVEEEEEEEGSCS